MISRRNIFKLFTMLPLHMILEKLNHVNNTFLNHSSPGINKNTQATIFYSANEVVSKCTSEIIEKIGGINALIDKEDIVIFKPNSQWWNQGMTNTDVMQEIISQILNIKGFSGEIIIADNHQSREDNARGWTTAERNGKFNLNELVQFFNDHGHSNVTKYHWHPAGPNPNPLQMDGYGNSVIKHPGEGDGYIWPEDEYYECPHGNKCILAYPVFTSKYSGITIDLKNGAFFNGNYTKQLIKFINMAALNHHSRYVGVTASVKNFMGVVDMSCGYPAPLPADTYNTHHIGASTIFKIMSRYLKELKDLPYFYDIYLHPSVFRFRYTGGVLGAFMKKIRRADINIITAINVGWGSRTDTTKCYQASSVLASTDPVALDYWAADKVLLPATIKSGGPETFIRLNDPKDKKGVLWMFLEECQKELGGCLDPTMMNIV